MALNREQVKAAYEAKRKQTVAKKKSTAPTREEAKRSWEQRVTAKRAKKAIANRKYVHYTPDEYKNDIDAASKGAEGYKLFENDLRATQSAVDEANNNKTFWDTLGEAISQGAMIKEASGSATSDPFSLQMNATAHINRTNKSNNDIPTDTWSEEQKNIFGYLYSIDPDAAYSYAAAENKRMSNFEKEKQLAIDTFGYDKRHENGFWSDVGLSAESVGYQFLGGFEGAANVLNGLTGVGVNETPYFSSRAQSMRNVVSQDMSDVVKFFYQTGMSMVDSGVSMAVGMLVGVPVGPGVAKGVSLALMSSQAAGVAMAEAKKKGYSDSEAVLVGMLAGGIEAGTEKIGLDALFDTGVFKNAGKNFFKKAGNYIVKNAGAEAAEEFLAEIGNKAVDFGVGALSGKGDKTDFARKVLAYMEEGKTKEEAIGLAVLSDVGDVGLASLGGAISGLGFGGLGSIINTGVQNYKDTKTGREIINRDNAKGLLLDAANASENQNLINLANKAKSAKVGTAKEARLTGEIARGVAEKARAIQAQKDSYLTLDEVRHLGGETAAAEYYEPPTKFEEAVAAFDKQIGEAQATENSRKVKARGAIEDGDTLSPIERYDGEVLRAYSEGTKSYEGLASAREIALARAKARGITTDGKSFSEIVAAFPVEEQVELLELNDTGYAYAFEKARSLGIRSRGKSLAQMLEELPASERDALLALSDDTLRAAFSAGAEVTRAAVARQAEIDRKIAKEREESSDSRDNSSEGKEKDKNKKKNPTNFTLEDTVNEASLTVTQREDVKIIRRVAEFVPGINFIITNQGVDSEGNYNAIDNGYYSDGEKTVCIDISAGRKAVHSAMDFAISLAGSHEVVHAIKANAPVYFEELSNFVIDTYYPGKTLDSVVRMRMQEYQKQENARAAAKGEKPKKITYDYALEEVIANSLENMFRSERVMFKLAKGHRRLFSRIWQYIRDFFNRVIRKIGQYSHRTVESTIVERANKSQRKLEDLFVKALRAANDGAAATRNESVSTNSEVRHSYAGKSAVTADKMKLSIAEEMLANGADSETVRKETGWFKGYDGKWRFEIEDSDIEIAFNGKLSRNPEIRRYSELLEKAYLLDSATQEEQNELAELDKKMGGKNIIPDKLGDMVKHPALFEAYPELADVGVYFHESDSNVASYHPGFKEISLPKRLRMNAKRFKTTLLHEIQHAVQDVEGFASGSNIDMFNGTEEFSAREQYENTAGEIEARDTANRAEMTAEQRKNTRPDIDRSDVVFAENSNISYALAKDAESEVEKVLIDKKYGDYVKLAENTPSILLSQNGVKNLPMLMKPSHIRENIFTESEALTMGYKVDGHTNYHGLGKEKFLEVIGDLDNVTEAYRGTKNAENPARREKYFLLISKQTDADGNVINVPVYINERGTYHRVDIDTNKIATVFGKGNLRDYINRELQKGNIVRIKNRSSHNSDSTAPIAVQYDMDASDNSISDSTEKSNTFYENSSENSGNKKFSHKEAEGREALIEAFSMLARSDSEKLAIDKYRRELSNIEEKIKERTALQDKLEELKGKSGKAQQRTELNAKIHSLTDYITRHDGKLLELRELAPFRDVMTRYSELSFERGLDRKEREVRMSRGVYNRILADYSHARVYTKRDAERSLEKIKGFEYVKGKLRDDLLNEYWEKLNSIENPGDERDIYIFLREKIVDAIESETRIENPDYAAAEERLAYFKGYVGHLAFSDDIKTEIRHKYDVDGSKAFFGRWGNKRPGATPVSADVFVTDFARENPGYEYLEEMSVADALFEINSVYEKAKTVPKEISAYDIASDDEIRALRSEVTDVLTEFMKNGGQKSKAAQNEELARSLHFKERLNEVMAINRAKIRLDQISQKLRDRKYGVFENVTEIKGTALAGLLRDLAAFNWRGTISMNNIREKVGKLLEWYDKDNPALEYVDENNTGYYRTDVREQLELLADGEHALKAYEYDMLYNVLSYFDNFADSYDKVWKNGRWIEAKDEAKRFIEIIDGNRKYNVGTVDKLIKNRYYELFGDPETLARGMDYYEDGFYTTMLEYLRRTSIDAQTAELNMLSEYNSFLEEHPDYLKRADTETAHYRGHEIPRLQLISLFMTLKRKHSHAGFVLSGFKYTALDGKTVVRASPMSVDPDLPQHEIEAIVTEEREKMASQLTAEDKRYIAILEEVYNNRAKELKRHRDMQRLGYSNVADDYYYPIRRSDSAKSIDTSEMQAELDRVSSASFNKDIVKGARHKLQIESADSLFRRHVRVVCQYAYIQEVIDYYDKVFHVTINDNKNDPRSIATESENLWAHGNEYFAAMISHIQGVMPKSREGMVLLGKIRSGFAKYQLGANPKVWLTQLSSLIASTNMLDWSSLIKATAVQSTDVDKYCSLARLRNEDNAAYMAQGVFDRTSVAGKAEGVISRAGDVLMVPIGKMDRAVVRHLFAACQIQVERDGGATVGTEENKVSAGELLESVILKTQQNALSTEKSAAMRSTNEILRALTMFSADSMKGFGRLLDAFGEYRTMRTKAAHSTGEARAQYLSRMKAAGRKIRKAVAATLGTSIFMVLIGIFFKHIRAKDDEITPDAVIIDGFGNLLGGLPLIRDAYSVIFNGYDLENFTYSAFNDVFQSVRSLGSNVEKLVTGERELSDVMRSLKSLLYSGGQITGIPVRNVYNYIHDLIARFAPEAAEEIDEFFGY